MDAACFDSAHNFIVAVAGGRVYRCDPTTGTILGQGDFQQAAFGMSTIVYDGVTQKCFAACMNTPHYDVAAFGGDRNLYRIVTNDIVDLTTNPSDQTINYKSTFGLQAPPAFQCGAMSMKILSGEVYLMGYSDVANPSLTLTRFNTTNPAINNSQNIGFSNYQSFALFTIAGEPFMFYPSQINNSIDSFGWSGTGFTNGATDATKGFYAIEYAPSTTNLYVTREFQFIDIWTSAVPPVYVTTINTGRSSFNGLNIRLNSVDGLLYIAGGADNTVIVLNPVGNTFVVKTGFDLPVDVVFTATKKFAVQRGSVAIKEIV